jgi:hypothetical protein
MEGILLYPSISLGGKLCLLVVVRTLSITIEIRRDIMPTPQGLEGNYAMPTNL